jgi:hypothetical protein
MKNLMKTSWTVSLPLLLVLLLTGPVLAQEKAADLPDAATIIENYIQATGGRDAYEKHHNMKMTGSFSMPAMGISAPLTTYQQAPNKGYTLIASQAFGTIESGSNGDIQWEKTMMTGAKIKDGEEKAVADRQGTFNMMLRWQDFFTSAETMAVEDVDGHPCYKVVMTPLEGSPEISWFDVETGLMVKSSMTITGDMGTISIDLYPSDYRDVDGVLVPFVAKQVLMGMQEMVVAAETVEWDVEIPVGTFDLPEDILALQEK